MNIARTHHTNRRPTVAHSLTHAPSRLCHARGDGGAGKDGCNPQPNAVHSLVQVGKLRGISWVVTGARMRPPAAATCRSGDELVGKRDRGRPEPIVASGLGVRPPDLSSAEFPWGGRVNGLALGTPNHHCGVAPVAELQLSRLGRAAKVERKVGSRESRLRSRTSQMLTEVPMTKSVLLVSISGRFGAVAASPKSRTDRLYLMSGREHAPGERFARPLRPRVTPTNGLPGVRTRETIPGVRTRDRRHWEDKGAKGMERGLGLTPRSCWNLCWGN